MRRARAALRDGVFLTAATVVALAGIAGWWSPFDALAHWREEAERG